MSKPLTFEQTRGTKTYHLPLERDDQTPPRMTLMLRRLPDGSFHAGMSVCALEDQFSKHKGRAAAFHRLNNIPIVAPDSTELLKELDRRLFALDANRPGTIPWSIEEDVASICADLDEIFDTLESNRIEKLMMEAAVESVSEEKPKLEAC